MASAPASAIPSLRASVRRRPAQTSDATPWSWPASMHPTTLADAADDGEGGALLLEPLPEADLGTESPAARQIIGPVVARVWPSRKTPEGRVWLHSGQAHHRATSSSLLSSSSSPFVGKGDDKKAQKKAAATLGRPRVAWVEAPVTMGGSSSVRATVLPDHYVPDIAVLELSSLGPLPEASADAAATAVHVRRLQRRYLPPAAALRLALAQTPNRGGAIVYDGAVVGVRLRDGQAWAFRCRTVLRMQLGRFCGAGAGAGAGADAAERQRWRRTLVAMRCGAVRTTTEVVVVSLRNDTGPPQMQVGQPRARHAAAGAAAATATTTAAAAVVAAAAATAAARPRRRRRWGCTDPDVDVGALWGEAATRLWLLLQLGVLRPAWCHARHHHHHQVQQRRAPREAAGGAAEAMVDDAAATECVMLDVPRTILLTGAHGAGKSSCLEALLSRLDVSAATVAAAAIDGETGKGADDEAGAQVEAGATGVTVLHTTGPELAQDFPGEPRRGLEEALARALRCAPCVLVLDRAETIFPAAPAGRDAPRLQRQARELATLLRGFPARAAAREAALARSKSPSSSFLGVVVVAVTCERDMLHAAVNGTFDAHVAIQLPGQRERLAGLRTLLGYAYESPNRPGAEGANAEVENKGKDKGKDKDDVLAAALPRLARRCHGFVGADLAAVVRKSLVKASSEDVRRGRGGYGAQEEEEEEEELVRQLESAIEAHTPALLRSGLSGEGAAGGGSGSGGGGNGLALSVPRVQWEDIGGLQHVKQVLIETLVWPQTHAAAFARMRIRPPRGVLMYGPPGTGKTLLAKAVASVCDAHFISVAISKLVRSGVGESGKALARLFALALQAAPCVLFLDEVQAMFGSRHGGDGGSGGGGGGGGGSQSYTGRLVSQLLLELDNLEYRQRQAGRHIPVLVLAATNVPSAIDSALLRPGRFDRALYVPLPNAAARQEILERLSARMRWAPDATKRIPDLVGRTERFSGADLARLSRAAALRAIGEARAQGAGAVAGAGSGEVAAIAITSEHLDFALDGMQPSISVEYISALEQWRPR